jgi:hypothetical protein
MAQPTITPEAIRSVLASTPLVVDLYDRVAEWFGDNLSARVQEPNLTASTVGFYYDLRIDPAPISFNLNICMDDDNAAGQIAHELLHLSLIVDGFAFGAAFQIDSQYPDWLDRASGAINNEVQHEIFFADFLRLGFARSQFLTEPSYEGGIAEQQRAMRANLLNATAAPHCRALWNRFYLSEWITQHLGFQNFAAEVQMAGSELFPSTMESDAIFIRQWVDAGEFRRPENYRREINELMDRIGFPAVDFRQVVRFDHQTFLD